MKKKRKVWGQVEHIVKLGMFSVYSVLGIFLGIETANYVYFYDMKTRPSSVGMIVLVIMGILTCLIVFFLLEGEETSRKSYFPWNFSLHIIGLFLIGLPMANNPCRRLLILILGYCFELVYVLKKPLIIIVIVISIISAFRFLKNKLS